MTEKEGTHMSIAENIQSVRARIAAACREAGCAPEEITLVGASKMNDAAACREAIAAGIDALGENRVQEMRQKLAENAYEGAPLHFIGHLQRNKVRQVVGSVALIQSVSSMELLDEIEKAAAGRNLRQEILLEVNIGREAAKSGFLPEKVFQAAEAALPCEHLRVRGLMAIPPVETIPNGNMPYFTKMKALYVDINSKLFHNKLECLSMGMSGDFEEAVRAGANMVRVGTAIFGARAYTQTN
jgi:pyridoxal phosphate enzyme (YggS family)